MADKCKAGPFRARPSPLVRFLSLRRELLELVPDRVSRLAGLLLDGADQAVELALGTVQVVVGQDAPGLLDPSSQLIHLAFDLTHGVLLSKGLPIHLPG